MRVVAIIQARMGSTRLPGKVLLDLAGEPMLARVVGRVRRARTVEEVVVATTTSAADEAIVGLCEERSWPCFRGEEDDVLDRYYRCACEYHADVVVRITSDCPLIDPGVIDDVVTTFLRARAVDYCTNTLPPRTYPRGLDVEVISFAALERAWREDERPEWREHVTPFIYRTPDRFSLVGVSHDEDYSNMRWTVDTPEDLAFVRLIYGFFGKDGFSWYDVVRVLRDHPEWIDINRNVEQRLVP